MSYESDAHGAQMAILKELLLVPAATFAALQKTTGLTSDHATFHIRKLVEAGYVCKNDGGQYTLTVVGKEYANRMDTDQKIIEKQAKVAVVLVIKDAQGRTLSQQRLKQPYYGFWGRPTGKIRWGETVLEAAARELMEETGLEADLEVKGMYHKMDFKRSDNEILEDKYFHIIIGTNPRGTLMETFEGGVNAWMSNEELVRQEKVFEDIADISERIQKPGLHFIEAKYHYDDAEY
jgi:8-oxo-dGTP pyrophosphatase MutT (NUDIX family)